MGQRGHSKSRGVIVFTKEKGTKIIIGEQDFLHTTE